MCRSLSNICIASYLSSSIDSYWRVSKFEWKMWASINQRFGSSFINLPLDICKEWWSLLIQSKISLKKCRRGKHLHTQWQCHPVLLPPLTLSFLRFSTAGVSESGTWTKASDGTQVGWMNLRWSVDELFQIPMKQILKVWVGSISKSESKLLT